MSRRSVTAEAGFTIVELTVTISLLAVISITFTTFFLSIGKNYLAVQKDGSTITALTLQANRVATVVRGLTDFVSAGANDMVIYSYFYPSDTYVSLVHYYVSGGSLYVDVTRMTANPPIGTPITSSLKTYTIIDTFYQPSGTNLFTYYNSAGVALAPPLANTNPVVSVQVNLAVQLANGGNQLLNVQTSLRNRKTNL